MVNREVVDADIAAMTIRLYEHIEMMHSSEPCFAACFDTIMALDDYKKSLRYQEGTND